MKVTLPKFALFAVVFIGLVAENANAQMYVSSNSYVFVNNEMLYVKQDVNLANTGNVYLRRQGQLLQGVAGTTSNTGLGKLSVFQEGTSDNFDYNYWCSPVGEASATVGNSPAKTATLFNVPTSITASNPAALVGGFDGSTSPGVLNIASRWLWKYANGSAYSQWVYVGDGITPLNPGEGFCMKGTTGTDATNVDGVVSNNPGAKQRIDFRGKPNDGDINIPVSAGQQTLTGNPYPSAMDLKAFLNSPSAVANTTGVAYFWEQDKGTNSHVLASYRGGYGTYSPVGGVVDGTYGNMGVYTPAVFHAYDQNGNDLGISGGSGLNIQRRFSPVGQGFQLEGKAGIVGVQNVVMSNAYRVFVKEVAAYSQFERQSSTANSTAQSSGFLPAIPSISGYDYTRVSTADVPQIRFNTLLDNQGIRQSVLAFDPAATDGIDYGMDAKSPDDGLPADMYFVLDNQQYVIGAISFDLDKKVPVGFKNTNAANYKITVNEILNAEGVENVYLHDKVNNTYHDIRNNFYELNLPAGVNNTQYEITFRDAALATDQNALAGSLTVYQNNGTKNLTISNPQMIDLKSCTMYDVAGKLIFTKNNLGVNAEYTFPTSNLSDGIYIVRVNTQDNNEIGKKVIVKH
jgi:type IX secretion system substrate protein